MELQGEMKSECPRCGGNLLADAAELFCLQCGHRMAALGPREAIEILGRAARGSLTLDDRFKAACSIGRDAILELLRRKEMSLGTEEGEGNS